MQILQLSVPCHVSALKLIFPLSDQIRPTEESSGEIGERSGVVRAP